MQPTGRYIKRQTKETNIAKLYLLFCDEKYTDIIDKKYSELNEEEKKLLTTIQRSFTNYTKLLIENTNNELLKTLIKQFDGLKSDRVKLNNKRTSISKRTKAPIYEPKYEKNEQDETKLQEAFDKTVKKKLLYMQIVANILFYSNDIDIDKDKNKDKKSNKVIGLQSLCKIICQNYESKYTTQFIGAIFSLRNIIKSGYHKTNKEMIQYLEALSNMIICIYIKENTTVEATQEPTKQKEQSNLGATQTPTQKKEVIDLTVGDRKRKLDSNNHLAQENKKKPITIIID